MPPGTGPWPTLGVNQVAAFSIAFIRWESQATQTAVFQAFNLQGGTYSFGGLAEHDLIPLPTPPGREGTSFLVFFPPNDTVNSKSMLCIKPGESSMVIGHQVVEPASTALEEHLFNHTFILGSQAWCQQLNTSQTGV